jgi:hypothetical protein
MAYWKSVIDLLICGCREYNQSVMAGTIMHGTEKPLSAWFMAIWWFTTHKAGVNAINKPAKFAGAGQLQHSLALAAKAS